MAPTNGYTDSIEISMVPGVSPDWSYTWGTNFLFYFGQPPKYGRMVFGTGGSSHGFGMQYWFNPSGSRNLEFDPSKQISP